jgi:hypothetical protein
MMVEAAIVFPLLLLLTLGAIEYGWLFLNLHQITNAARQGARTAAVFGATDTDGDNAIDGALSGTYVFTQPSFYRHVGPTVIGGTIAGKEAEVRVDSSDIVIVNLPALFPVPAQLRAIVKMAKEGS